MQNSKLTELLGSLSNRELNKFEKYINADFFNKNENVIKLFNSIKKRHPDYNHKDVLKEQAFKKLFPKETFNEQKLRYVMTDLTKLLEDYIALIEFESDPVRKNHILLKGLDKRSLGKYFEQSLSEVRKQLDRSNIRDSEYYYHHYILDSENYIFNSSSRNRAKIGVNLENAINNLNLFYLSSSLKYYCELLTRQKVFSAETSESFFNQVLTFLENHTFDDVPAISIYYEISMLIKTGNQEHYYNLKKLLDDNNARFPKKELRDIYTAAQNYCIEKINKGEPDYLKELFVLYKQILDQDILLMGGYLPQWDYKNIVTVALRLEEYEWAENFILSYEERLHPDHRVNAYTYCLAILNFFKRNYKETLRLLLNVEFTDVVYQLDSKSLLMKTYYEINSIEPLMSLADSFKVYLSRNKFITDDLKTAYNNQIRFIRKLLSFKLDSKGDIGKIKTELEVTKPIVDLTWLSKKAGELN